MTHVKEVIREVSLQLPTLSTGSTDTEVVRELNYRLRKVTENLIALSSGDDTLLNRAVNLYLRLGDNYQLLNMSPEIAVKNLSDAVEELMEVVEELCLQRSE